jgi:hypothetical protein
MGSNEKYEPRVSTSLEHEEDTFTKSKGDDGELLHPEVRQYAERKLVRKLDYRLLPTIILIFILNYIDVSEQLGRIWIECL